MLLGNEERISCVVSSCCETGQHFANQRLFTHFHCAQEYQSINEQGQPHVLLDVREPAEYAICHLSGSHSILPTVATTTDGPQTLWSP